MRVRIISVANKRYAQNKMRAETKNIKGNPFFADQEKHNFLVCFCFLLQINATTGRYAVVAEGEALTGRYTVKADIG